MTMLADAAEITGMAQQALEKLHQLQTYELTSLQALRHQRAFDDVRQHLTAARNTMASLSLALGKD